MSNVCQGEESLVDDFDRNGRPLEQGFGAVEYLISLRFSSSPSTGRTDCKGTKARTGFRISFAGHLGVSVG